MNDQLVRERITRGKCKCMALFRPQAFRLPLHVIGWVLMLLCATFPQKHKFCVPVNSKFKTYFRPPCLCVLLYPHF